MPLITLEGLVNHLWPTACEVVGGLIFKLSCGVQGRLAIRWTVMISQRFGAGGFKWWFAGRWLVELVGNMVLFGWCLIFHISGTSFQLAHGLDWPRAPLLLASLSMDDSPISCVGSPPHGMEPFHLGIYVNMCSKYHLIFGPTNILHCLLKYKVALFNIKFGLLNIFLKLYNINLYIFCLFLIFTQTKLIAYLLHT